VKIIEIIADAGHEDTIHGLAEQFEVSDISVKLLLDDISRQAVLD
jgi:hypothetical protein